MKYILFLFFFFSCSKSIKYSNLEQSKTLNILNNSKPLNGELDMFVAFYWPNTFESGESDLVDEIITESQNLIKIKESYYSNKFKYTCQFDALDCFCVINRTCNEEPTPQRYNQCQEIDEQLQLNDDQLIDFSISIFNIQDNLEKFTHKGYWIKTHSDFQRNEITLINSTKKTIFIPSWDEENSNITTQVKFSPRRIDFSFNHSNQSRVKAFADVKETKFYQQGIGEIEEYKKTKLLRKGVLFFESSNLSNLKCNQETFE